MTPRMHPRVGSADHTAARKAQIDTAVRLIERGQHLVPVHIVNPETGRCTCLDRDYWTTSNGRYHEPACAKNSKSWGKHPIDAQWQQSAPLDRAGLEREFLARPYLNLGVLCGTPVKDRPGFVRLVIDMDGRAGHEQLANLETQLGPLPRPTYIVVTGREEADGERSGLQLHYAVPESYAARIKSAAGILAPNLDIRFGGSQAIAPGSLHQNGNLYYAPDLDAPEAGLEEGHPWLEYMAGLSERGNRKEAREDPPEPPPKEPRRTAARPNKKRFEQFWLAVGAVSALREDGSVEVRIHGKKYAQREPAINAAAFMAGRFAIPPADVERQLLAAAAACGALAKYGPEKLTKTIRDAYDAGSQHPLGEQDAVPRDPDEIAAEYGVTFIDASILAQKQFPKIESILTSAAGRGLLEIGTRRPHGLFGYPEAGKSTLAHQLAKCVVAGLPFLGLTPLKCEVLFWKTEDGERQVQRELLAHGNGNPAGLHYLFSPEGLSLADNLALVVAELRKFPGIRLALIETLECFTAVNKENERDEWRTAFGSIQNVLCAPFPDKAFTFLHHLGKASKGENPSLFSIRGSSNIPAHTADKIYLHADPGRNDQRIVKATSRGSGFRLEETYLNFDPNTLWSSIDRTKREVEEEKKAARATKAAPDVVGYAEGVDLLREEIRRRERENSLPILKTGGVDFLSVRGLRRAEARLVVEDSAFIRIKVPGTAHSVMLKLAHAEASAEPSAAGKPYTHGVSAAADPSPQNTSKDATFSDLFVCRGPVEHTANEPPSETRVDKDDFETAPSAAEMPCVEQFSAAGSAKGSAEEFSAPAENPKNQFSENQKSTRAGISADIFPDFSEPQNPDQNSQPNGHGRPDPNPETDPDGLVEEVVRLVESGEALDDDAILARLPGRRPEDVQKAIQLAVERGWINPAEVAR